MELKLKFSAKNIYDKEFLGSTKGYDALQVDQFLDEIIKDYQQVEAFNKEYLAELNKITEENKMLINMNSSLKAEISILENKLKDFKEHDNSNLANIDYLKKISAYEKMLSKLGVDPNTVE